MTGLSDVDEAILSQDDAREATLPPDDNDEAFLRTLTDTVDVLASFTSATKESIHFQVSKSSSPIGINKRWWEL